MTFLIIGGLLAVALLAILGAIFLGMSAQRSEKVQTNGVTTLSLPPQAQCQWHNNSQP